MTDAYEDVLGETRRHVARLQGELAAVRDQLASALAAEIQLRQEIEACRTEAALAAAELTHAQRVAAERDESARHRVAELDERLDEARRLQGDAEKERAAVIAALGMRARRRLGRAGDSEE